MSSSLLSGPNTLVVILGVTFSPYLCRLCRTTLLDRAHLALIACSRGYHNFLFPYLRPPEVVLWYLMSALGREKALPAPSLGSLD